MLIKPGLSNNEILPFLVIGQENDAKPKYFKDGKIYNLYIDKNDVIIYEKTKGEYVPVFDDDNTQTTTTNESPEQRWISEHSNGSFKKLNPNKPTTWLYYTEPNNQGDRYIYKDNQFIQK